MNLRQGVGTGAVLYYPALSHGAPSHQKRPSESRTKERASRSPTRETTVVAAAVRLAGHWLLALLARLVRRASFRLGGPASGGLAARRVRRRERRQARRRRLRCRGSRQPLAEKEPAAQSLLAGPRHCLGRAEGGLRQPGAGGRSSPQHARGISPHEPGPRAEGVVRARGWRVVGPSRRTACG